MRGVKPRKSCFAVPASLHASLNVQPVIHHPATNRQTNSNSNKIQQLLEKNNRMQGTNAKKGRYKTSWVGSTLSHIEKTVSFIMW